MKILNNFSVAEYDPNPLLSLSKRKRRVSTSVSTDEKSQKNPITVSLPSRSIPQPLPQVIAPDKGDQESTTSSDNYRERKRLKKKKREKMRQKLLRQDKKKKKKHKCNDVENCKHRKHKKHRKRKKHHEKNKEERQEESMLVEELEPEEATQDEVDDDEELVEDDIEMAVSHGYSNEIHEGEEFVSYSNDVPNAEDEVTMDDIFEATQSKVFKLNGYTLFLNLQALIFYFSFKDGYKIYLLFFF